MPEWLWPVMMEWAQLHRVLAGPSLQPERRGDTVTALANFILDLRLSLGQHQFYEALRRAWQTHKRLEERLAVARELFDHYRPQTPGAALIFPHFRHTFEYREDGFAENRYEFSVANIGPEPMFHYDNWTNGHEPMAGTGIGLRISQPDGRPAADVEWLPGVGSAVRWRARLLRPLQPGECREFIEQWVWRYVPPLAAIRNNSDTLVVNAFIGDLEIVIGYPKGYVSTLNTAWMRGCDGALRVLEVRPLDIDRSVLVVRDELPPFGGSDQLTRYSVLQQIEKVDSAPRR